jgi:hypothetical protein
MSKRKTPLAVTDAEAAAIRQAAASDPDARELSDAELAEFRPASEVLPRILGRENAEALMKPSWPSGTARRRTQGVDEHAL